jgi:GT2 family glycosyltransferase
VTQAPRCSVVVAVSRDNRVRRLLESLTAQSMPPSDLEVIVVENGSCDLADVAGLDPRIRYLHLPDANMAAARNAGLQAARGTYLLTTDADVVVAPDWAQQMVDALSVGPHGSVGGPIRKLAADTWVQAYAITIVDGQTELSYLPALPLPYVAGANAGYVTEALREVGGFDDRFHSGSDVDICYRMGLAGHSVGLAPLAIVFHDDRATLRSHFHRFRTYAIYQVLLFAVYRRISRRGWVVNAYPIKRLGAALAAVPAAAFALLRGEAAPAQRAVLQIVEAVGVWAGDIQGSIRYRQFYI